MKCTRYFLATRQQPGRLMIRDEWIQRGIDHAVNQTIQNDRRISPFKTMGLARMERAKSTDPSELEFRPERLFYGVKAILTTRPASSLT